MKARALHLVLPYKIDSSAFLREETTRSPINFECPVKATRFCRWLASVEEAQFLAFTVDDVGNSAELTAQIYFLIRVSRAFFECLSNLYAWALGPSMTEITPLSESYAP